jgi:uncharacterized membrane protein YczE
MKKAVAAVGALMAVLVSCVVYGTAVFLRVGAPCTRHTRCNLGGNHEP